MPIDHPVRGTVRRADLAARVADLGLPRRDAALLVGAVLDEVVESLGRGEPVRLAGFGSFHVVRRARRPARDLATGAAVVVPERASVVFRPSPGLREALTVALGLVEQEP